MLAGINLNKNLPLKNDMIRLITLLSFIFGVLLFIVYDLYFPFHTEMVYLFMAVMLVLSVVTYKIDSKLLIPVLAVLVSVFYSSYTVSNQRHHNWVEFYQPTTFKSTLTDINITKRYIRLHLINKNGRNIPKKLTAYIYAKSKNNKENILNKLKNANIIEIKNTKVYPYRYYDYTHFKKLHNYYGYGVIYVKEDQLRIIKKINFDDNSYWQLLTHYINNKRNQFTLDTLAIKNSLDKDIGEMIGIIIALTTGSKSLLATDVYEKFKILGQAHVLAVSGMHVGLIIGLIYLFIRKSSAFLFRHSLRDSRNFSLLISLCILVLYLLFIQPSSSMERAGIMSSIALLSLFFQRRITSLNVLLFSAVVLLIFDPLACLHAGFQMSFIATWVLIIYFSSQTFKKRIYNVKDLKFLSKMKYLFIHAYVMPAIMLSLLISVVLLPITIFFFGTVSFAGIWTSLLFNLSFSTFIMPMVLLTLILFIFNLPIYVYIIKFLSLFIYQLINVVMMIDVYKFNWYYAYLSPIQAVVLELLLMIMVYVLIRKRELVQTWILTIVNLIVLIFIYQTQELPNKIIMNKQLLSVDGNNIMYFGKLKYVNKYAINRYLGKSKKNHDLKYIKIHHKPDNLNYLVETNLNNKNKLTMIYKNKVVKLY